MWWWWWAEFFLTPGPRDQPRVYERVALCLSVYCIACGFMLGCTPGRLGGWRSASGRMSSVCVQLPGYCRLGINIFPRIYQISIRGIIYIYPESHGKYQNNWKCPFKANIWLLCQGSRKIRLSLRNIAGLAAPLCKYFTASETDGNDRVTLIANDMVVNYETGRS